MKVKVKKEDIIRLISSKALKSARVHSKYRNKDTNMRVKMTYTFSGAGILVPIFISVRGLTVVLRN